MTVHSWCRQPGNLSTRHRPECRPVVHGTARRGAALQPRVHDGASPSVSSPGALRVSHETTTEDTKNTKERLAADREGIGRRALREGAPSRASARRPQTPVDEMC